jgi:hypothetical protein
VSKTADAPYVSRAPSGEALDDAHSGRHDRLDVLVIGDLVERDTITPGGIHHGTVRGSSGAGQPF